MTSANDAGAATEIDYVAVEQSAPFQALKRTQRSFIFPMAIAFLVWYFAYVLTAAFAPEFMAGRIGDSNITIGLVLGLGQFVTTFVITMWYVSFANSKLDAQSRSIREELERVEAGA